MKHFKLLTILFLNTLTISVKTQDNPWNKVGNYLSSDSMAKKGYTLIFINKDSAFATAGNQVKQRMENTLFEVYLKLAKVELLHLNGH